VTYIDAITKSEDTLLVDYYKKGGNTLIRARAQTILMSSKGLPVRTIASLVLYEEQTIRDWITAFENTRISSIFPSYEGNENAAKLTRKQKDEISETLKKPDGLPYDFLNISDIKDYVHTTFGVVYESDQSYYYLLKHCGLSFKLPSPFDIRRNDGLVEKRIAEIRNEIKPLLTQEDTIIFAADEARINYDEEIRRCWLRKGQKTVIKIKRDKSQKQNYFGALNLTTHKHELIQQEWHDTENTIEALRELTRRYPNKNIHIIWDNARWHRSKELRALLGTGNEFEHIHLIWLPPYAPDENPQEHVWKFGKEAIRSRHFTSFNELQEKFESTITSRIFDYKF
jgi:transposase